MVASGILAAIGLILFLGGIGALSPKKDKRFKTGYKDNIEPDKKLASKCFASGCLMFLLALPLLLVGSLVVAEPGSQIRQPFEGFFEWWNSLDLAIRLTVYVCPVILPIWFWYKSRREGKTIWEWFKS